MKIVFTDLDGTLIDFKNYSFEESLPSVEKLKKHSIPLVFATGKTPAENEYYQNVFGLHQPFITENGSAVYIPKKYFDFKYGYSREWGKYNIIELGVSYKIIKKAMREIREKTGCNIKGRKELTAEEVAKEANMSYELAELARRRKYSESFSFEGNMEVVRKAASKYSLTLVHGGKYMNLIGSGADKGKAAGLLIGLYKRKWGDTVTYGIGDSENDIPLLRSVDNPILVSAKRVYDEKFYLTSSTGPSGFAEAVEDVILREPEKCH